MRTALLLIASLSSLTARTADACGNYRPEPQVFRLSTHFIPLARNTEGRRTFVVLAEPAPKGADWKLLAPMSYDGTQVADAPSLPRALTFTLVGPAGTRVVESKKHVFLRRSWAFEKTAGGIEVDAGRDDLAIAIEGVHEDATWTALDSVVSTPNDAAWVGALGFAAEASSIYISRVHGTDLEAVSVYSDGKTITFLRQRGRNHGRMDGSALGAVTFDGVMRLITSDGNRTSTVDLQRT